MDGTALLFVIALPLVVALAIAGVMAWQRTSPRTTWAVAVAFGFVIGQVALKSRAGWDVAYRSLIRPSEARDWLPVCVLLAVGAAILSSSGSLTLRRWTAALIALLVVAVPLRLMASNVRLAEAWSVPQKVGCVALLAATFGFVWLMLELSGEHEGPLFRLILLVIVALGSAVVITLAGTMVGGQLCAVLASALFGAAFGQWIAMIVLGGPSLPGSDGASRQSVLAGLNGVAGVVTVALGGLIVLASFYAELAPIDAAMLFLSLIAAAGPLPAMASLGPRWFQASIRAALCLFPLTIAIVRSLPT